MNLPLLFLLLIFLFPGAARAGEKRAKKELADTDRVLLLGGGFIEQERVHCYLETRLLRHHPRGNLLFRNLGWGGDTVRGTARTGGFQNPEGFARLFKEVKQWEPTVILIGYGMNESFAGAPGIPAFVKDYGDLLDKLAPLKARLILLSPTYHEPLGPPYPDPARHNEEVKTYGEAIRGLAGKRDLEYIDLFGPMKAAKEKEPERAFTTNGIQPNAAGYAVIARAIEDSLGYPPMSGWSITASTKGIAMESVGAAVKSERTKRGLRLEIQESALPMDDPFVKAAFFLTVQDLPAGMHVLEIEGKELARATAEDWGRGLSIPLGTEAGKKLRQAVIAKNELWYRRWRPFNDHSRHFDFLKGDFSLYDKAIAEQERVIHAMQTPRPYSIEIVPLGK